MAERVGLYHRFFKIGVELCFCSNASISNDTFRDELTIHRLWISCEGREGRDDSVHCRRRFDGNGWDIMNEIVWAISIDEVGDTGDKSIYRHRCELSGADDCRQFACKGSRRSRGQLVSNDLFADRSECRYVQRGHRVTLCC